MNLRGLPVVFAVVLLTGVAQGAGLLTVDTFDVSQFDEILGSPAGPSTTSASGAGILGGTRDMTLTTTAGLPFQSLASDANLTLPSRFTHSQGSTIIGSTLLEWDGGAIGFDPTGLGGIDVTDGGLIDQIGIRVSSDDLPVDIKLTAFSSATDFSDFTLSLPGGIFTDTDFFINFADFVATGGTGADFTNLGALQLFVDGQIQGTDLIFDFIDSAVVPEPASLFGWMVCMITAGVFVYRRKGLVRG